MHPRKVHSVIQEKRNSENIIFISKLAEELKVTDFTLLEPAIAILKDLQMIELSECKTRILLTGSGILSHPEY